MRTIACWPGLGLVLPRARERFRRVYFEREPDTQRTGGEADRYRDDENNCDAVKVQHQPPRKVGV